MPQERPRGVQRDQPPWVKEYNHRLPWNKKAAGRGAGQRCTEGITRLYEHNGAADLVHLRRPSPSVRESDIRPLTPLALNTCH